MNNYSDPMVTYDEIVEALRAIIDCSKANGYLEEYGFLNVKYDSLNQNSMQEEQEQALLKALQSLEKTIESANHIIRDTLEKDLSEINVANVFKIVATYEHSYEKRKLASQSDLVMRLKEMSLPLNVLSKVKENNEIIESLSTKVEEVSAETPIFGFGQNIEDTDEEVVRPVEIVEIDEEPTTNKPSNVDSNKIQLIVKALEKAREKNNEQLIKVLELQLRRELDNLK